MPWKSDIRLCSSRNVTSPASSPIRLTVPISRPSGEPCSKKRFPSLYVRESYGVMLYHALSLLEPNGRLVFITPDTFLSLHRHEVLRRALLSQSTIEEVTLFPSKFFPGVKFGYSGLCILTAVKARPAPAHKVRIIERLYDSSVLLELARADASLSRCSISEVTQADLQARDHAELVRPSANGRYPPREAGRLDS